MLLKALDDRLQLTDRLAACLPDRRGLDKVRHAVCDLLRQRIFGLACGYEGGNDAARLADDPLHKLAVGRDPVTGDALASQSTLSRFESAVSPRALYRMGRTLAAAQKIREYTVERMTITVAENGWFAARPFGTEGIYKIYAESFRGADHLRRILEEARTIVSDVLAAVPQQSGIPSEPTLKEKL